MCYSGGLKLENFDPRNQGVLLREIFLWGKVLVGSCIYLIGLDLGLSVTGFSVLVNLVGKLGFVCLCRCVN